MAKFNHDCNMLFGVLAVQMDFISRDQLVAAMNAWVLEKEKELGAILVDQKVLSPERRTLLQALMQEHLKQHHNDPQQSLAAVSSVDSVKERLARIPDADVQASIAPLATRSTPVPRPGAETDVHATKTYGGAAPAGGRFRILRPHAKGGLGEIFVAHDEELHREVALKEIQSRHAQDQESRSRFLLEAEITGGLEHPGIVPVYGLGQYADGRPFYAMRFIKGDSLKEAIQRHHQHVKSGASAPGELLLDFRSLIGRLVDVCNAMQYAHDRGVLHRDIKPGNIMLGNYGETLVVDWGLAKSFGADDPPGKMLSGDVGEKRLRPSSASGSAETMAGSAIGTPAYMSPEQAAGRIELLGPASDVYSLGATLYFLLTGVPPVEDRDMGVVLKKVQKGDFPSPRQLKPDVSPALEAICLKAMSLKPGDRYATPKTLANDLEQWLADEPVSAYRDPWTVTARRWIGKHRTLVTGGAAALVVGIVSLTTATILLAQKNEEIQNTNRDLTNANQVINQQNVEIKAESDEKDRQRKLAESRLRQSLAAVGLFANDARRYCEDALVPGDSRRRLYEVLIKQLEEQAGQEPGEATIDRLRNKALMYRTLCSVHLDFYNYSGADVAFDKAFEKGIRAVEQWTKLRPADADALALQAGLLHLRAGQLAISKKTADAKQLHLEALEIRRKVAGNVGVELGSKVDGVAAIADSLDGLERYDASLGWREKICNHFEQLEKKAAAKDEQRAIREQSYPYREAWCWTYQKAGLHATDYATRKKYLTAADEMSDALLRERPTNRSVRLRWATIVKMLGELEYNFGKIAEKEGKKKEAEQHFDDAAEYYKKLNEVSRGLATSDEIVDGMRDYSRSFYTLGLAEQRKGNGEIARRLYERSRIIRNEVFLDHQKSANSLNLQIDLFFSQIALGQTDEAINMIESLFVMFRDEPETSYRAACLCALAIAAIEDNRKPAPLTPGEKRMQARLRSTAIRCLQIAHDGGFSDFFQTSIDSDFDAIRDDPRMTEFEASHQYRQGLLEIKRGDEKRAKAHFEQARALLDTWLKGAKEERQVLLKIDRMCIDMHLGRSIDVLRQADWLYDELERNRPAMFRLARVYAIAATAESDAQKQSHYRDKALTALERAADFATRYRLAAQDEFDVIRDDARFKQILQNARR